MQAALKPRGLRRGHRISGKVAAYERAASCASLPNHRQIVFLGFIVVRAAEFPMNQECLD